jgi:hypothetical protein
MTRPVLSSLQLFRPLLAGSLFLLFQQAMAQENAASCDKVLTIGIINETLIKSSSQLREAFDDYIYQSDFGTHEEAMNAGLSIGTVVYGIPLKLGATFSKQQKDTWFKQNMQDRKVRRNQAQSYEFLRKEVSTGALDRWVRCKEIAAASKPGLYAWMTRLDRDTVRLINKR